MKYILAKVFTCVAAVSISFNSIKASGAGTEQYPFPFTDPLVATIFSGAYNTDQPYEELNFEFKSDRRNVALFEGRNILSFAFFKQTKKAPLIFVVPGAGGQAYSGAALLLAGQLYKMGFSVVTVPDSVSWPYTLGRSESALPGYMPRDSKEFYNFLKELTEKIKRTTTVKISGYGLVGYSLGALLSGFLAQEDSVQHFFNFFRVLLINPATDVEFGLNTLDEYYAAGSKVSEQRKTYLIGTFLEATKVINEKGIDFKYISELLNKVKLRSNEKKWIIGESFREDLSSVIFVSQQIFDLGILKNPATYFNRDAREVEAKSISFGQYFKDFVYPSITKREANLERPLIVANTNLYALRDFLKSDKNIYAMENADDFLLHGDDIDFLKKTFTDRLYLYPLGGHIGNFLFPINQQDFKNIMTQ